MDRTVEVRQKAMDSILQAYREVLYLDLEKDTYEVVLPEPVEQKRTGKYQAAMEHAVVMAHMTAEDGKDLRQYLSAEAIREALWERDVLEIRCLRRNQDGAIEHDILTVGLVERRNGVPVEAALAIRSIEAMLHQETAQREHLARMLQAERDRDALEEG
jgi:hypothetical protein